MRGGCARGPSFGSGTLRSTNVDGGTPPTAGTDSAGFAAVSGIVRGSRFGRSGAAGATDSDVAAGFAADSRSVLGSRLG
ncbi:hypothetical protein [Streptomyces tailanensis]|uniref:hypothetical protein n=1 Tax=Streptomyces tailanensis TaxID=2569858 RepID=UPI001FE9BFA9|nr:hypothetical protein [Streptomyces tailanensis]